MKKTIALLLGLMLVLGFALVACNDDATDDGTDVSVEDASTTSTVAANPDAVDWSEAADYEEQEATLTGVVIGINDIWTEKQIPKVLLQVGDAGTDPDDGRINVVIKLNPDGTVAEGVDIDLTTLQGLMGKTVEVTGTVKLNAFEPYYEIFLTDNDDASLVVGSMKVLD